jgi:hypothetical protein
MDRMLINEANMRTTLIDLSSRLQSAGARLNGSAVIYHKVRYLELQECCETLLEDVNRGYGDNEKHISEVRKLERNVDLWIAELNNEDV